MQHWEVLGGWVTSLPPAQLSSSSSHHPSKWGSCSFKACQFLQDTQTTGLGPEISQRVRDWCQEVIAEVSPMMHRPHARSSVTAVVVAPPLPSRCAHPLAGIGVPQPCDTGPMAAITPSQPLAQSLPTLCPLPTDNKLRAWAWTRRFSVCRARADVKGPCNIQGGNSQQRKSSMMPWNHPAAGSEAGQFSSWPGWFCNRPRCLTQWSGRSPFHCSHASNCYQPTEPSHPPYTNTAASSLPPWASWPFPKSSSSLSSSKPCSPFLAPVAAPVLAPCPSFPHPRASPCPSPLLPQPPPTLSGQHEGPEKPQDRIAKLGCMHILLYAFVHPCADALRAAVWLWPPLYGISAPSACRPAPDPGCYRMLRPFKATAQHSLQTEGTFKVL